MNWSPPSRIAWWVAVALVILGIIGHFLQQPVLKEIGFWFEVVAAVLLLASTRLKGL